MSSILINWKLIRGILLLSLITIVSGGCRKEEDNKASSGGDIAPAHVQLHIGPHQIEYAGVYAAMEQGYFEDENIEFELVIHNTLADTQDILASLNRGEAVFAIDNAEDLLTVREQGNDLVAVSTLYIRDSRSVIALAARNINVPGDLIGKRILVIPGTENILQVFLKAVDLTAEQMTIVSAKDMTADEVIGQLISGEADATIYSLEVAAQFESAGMDVTRLAFFDYSVLSYDNVIYTSDKLIREQPTLVQRFVNAVLRGIQYTTLNPEIVAEQFVSSYGEQLHPLQREVQDEAILAIMPLMQSATTKPGVMTAETWDYLTANLTELGLLDGSVKATDAYNMRFVDAYYK